MDGVAEGDGVIRARRARDALVRLRESMDRCEKKLRWTSDYLRNGTVVSSHKPYWRKEDTAYGTFGQRFAELPWRGKRLKNSSTQTMTSVGNQTDEVQLLPMPELKVSCKSTATEEKEEKQNMQERENRMETNEWKDLSKRSRRIENLTTLHVSPSGSVEIIVHGNNEKEEDVGERSFFEHDEQERRYEERQWTEEDVQLLENQVLSKHGQLARLFNL